MQTTTLSSMIVVICTLGMFLCINTKKTWNRFCDFGCDCNIIENKWMTDKSITSYDNNGNRIVATNSAVTSQMMTHIHAQLGTTFVVKMCKKQVRTKFDQYLLLATLKGIFSTHSSLPNFILHAWTCVKANDSPHSCSDTLSEATHIQSMLFTLVLCCEDVYVRGRTRIPSENSSASGMRWYNNCSSVNPS